jgi:hypothetical protein
MREPPSNIIIGAAQTCDLMSARPGSGCRDGAIRWILGSGYHRNGHKQFERGVPPSLIVSLRRRPATEQSLSKFTPGAWLLSRLSWQPGSDDRMPEERGEKSNHNNAKD